MSDAPRKEIPRPKGDDDFEDLALALFRAVWRDPNAKLHGRPGQRQQGVDLYGEDRFGGSGLTGVQCKHHGSATHIKDEDLLGELQEEVEKAKGFKPPLQRFLFATTARRSAKLQQRARELTEQNGKQGLFAVEALGWQDLEDLLRRHPDVLSWYLGDRKLRGQVPGAYRCMAPAREPFVQRGEYAKVRNALLVSPDRADSSETATVVGITTAIHGAGGFGKTAVAIELCYDKQIRKRYPDGILWATLGEEIGDAGRLARIRDLIRWWTAEDPPAFETVSAASSHLRKELEGRQVLLVVDDVWRPGDVIPFQGLDAKAALLVTTRDSRTLPAESRPVHVDALALPEAVLLLGFGLPDTGIDLRSLATRLGEWPLLLKIVNRQLRELIQDAGLSPEQALREVNEALGAEGLTAFDREDLESRGQAVARTIGASLRRLSEEEVGRFEQLAIFPEDKSIPLRVLEGLWDLSSFATKKLCGRLHDLSLLLRFDRLAGTIRLHDVIRAYLLKKGESHLAAWNRRLLNAFRPASGRWADLPREESYLWHHLIHHLMGAGQGDVCRDLLLHFDYLRSKLEATDFNALIADYSSFAEKDEELRAARDALRLSAHVLAESPAEFRGQLWGRLMDRREAGLQGLLRSSQGSNAPWLRPRTASLARPGGPLLRTIEHPGSPETLAVLPDGRVVSGSNDGTLRVWDVESGEVLQTIAGTSSVNALAVLDNRRVVSGSEDHTLRAWDLESAQVLGALDGYSGKTGQMLAEDTHRVIFLSQDGTLRAWDVESGRVSEILEGGFTYNVDLTILDGRRLISRLIDGTLQLWDRENGQPLQVIAADASRVVVLDERRVASISGSEVLKVWDVESGQVLQVLKSSREFYIHSILTMVALDGRWVVTGDFDGALQVWDLETKQVFQLLERGSMPVVSLAALDGGRVVSGSLVSLQVWDVTSRQNLPGSSQHTDIVLRIAALDRGRAVSVAGARDSRLLVWDVESSRTLRPLEGPSGEGVPAAVAAVDDRRLVTAHLKTLRVLDVENGQTLQVLERSSSVDFVAVLDSDHIIFGSHHGMLMVWNLKNGRARRKLEYPYGITAIALLDRRRVVLGFSRGSILISDLKTGQSIHTLLGHSNSVMDVAVLDGRRVVSGAWDGTLRVWDVENGQPLKVLGQKSSEQIDAIAILDRHRVVSGSDLGKLRVWNVESGETESSFTLEAPVTAVTVMPGSRILVAGDFFGRIHFFDFVEP